MTKRYLTYLARWQLSTPILAAVMLLPWGVVINTIVANLVGGLIFFWIDRRIFKGAK